MDTSPPAAVTTLPADRATDVPTDVEIEIVFDEPFAPNVQAQIARLVVFNPDRPEVVTNVSGDKIEIQPRSPLEPNTTYSVVVLPGIPDRRNVMTAEPVRLTFSTGGPLTLTLLRGRVTIGDQPAPEARIYAFNRDRDFGYRTFADSAGAFELQSVAVGSYDITAWKETNGEEGFQYTLEPGDTTSGQLERAGTGLELSLTLTVADTSSAKLVRAEPVARDGLRVLFSDTLAAEQPLDSVEVELLALPPEVAPRGVALDSIPQSAVRGETIAVPEVRREAGEPRGLLARIGGALADSAAYAVRAVSLRNAAGLVTPADAPYLLFRTREVPDSTLAAPPPAPGEPAPAAPAQPDTVAPVPPPGAPQPGPQEERAPGDTVEGAARADTVAEGAEAGPAAPADTVPEGAEAGTLP